MVQAPLTNAAADRKGMLILNARAVCRVDRSALFAPSLMLIGLLVGHLKFHDYPLWAPEAVIVVIAIATIGVLLGLYPALLGPTNRRALVLGLILLLFLDLQFGSNAYIRNLLDDVHGLPGWLFFGLAFGVGFVAFLVIMSLREHIATIFVTGFGVFLLSTLVVPSPSISFGAQRFAQQTVTASTDPPVVHLILDGHLGIEGIPVDLAGGPDTKAALLQFYEKWGFHLYGGAYSPYLMTLNSVGNLMNGAASNKDLSYFEDDHNSHRGYRLAENRYFRMALQAKQSIRVFQSDYVDFCADAEVPVEFCFTYATSSINSLVRAELSAVAKARIILDTFLRRENITGKIYSALVSRSFYSSIAVPDVFTTLRKDILDNPLGSLFFAHLMLPHDPYVWDEQCQLRTDVGRWKSRRIDHTDLTTIGTAEYREYAYADYFDQIHCVMRLLDDLLTSIDDAGLLRDATVIIHGDHGSRIALRDPIIGYRDEATKTDYIDSFSTLFAIRSPDIETGYSSELQPLPNLIAEHLLAVPVPMDETTVYLRKSAKLEGLELMPVPMPGF